MNGGILQTSLSGAVKLQLEYREPMGKATETPQERAHTAQQLAQAHAKTQIADAFAWLLHVI